MGQSASKNNEAPEEEIQNGVMFTPQFIARVSGNPVPARSGQGSEAQASRGSPPGTASTTAEADARGTIQRSPLLQRALHRSRRVGDMLLSREEEELAAVEKLANEMLEKEYSAPIREAPCQTESAACLECYEKHADDPTKCAAAVAAYSSCARAATAQALAAER